MLADKLYSVKIYVEAEVQLGGIGDTILCMRGVRPLLKETALQDIVNKVNLAL